MKKTINLILLLIVATLSPQQEIQARAVAKNHWMDGQILVIDFNGKQMRFLGWTDDAKYYWEHGTLPPAPPSGDQAKIAEIINMVNQHSSSIRQQNQTIRDQASEIATLRNKVEQQQKQIESLRASSRTAIWTDTKGNSFAGELIEYELAAAKIKKTSDGIIYTVPISKLDSESQKLAIALDKK